MARPSIKHHASSSSTTGRASLSLKLTQAFLSLSCKSFVSFHFLRLPAFRFFYLPMHFLAKGNKYPRTQTLREMQESPGKRMQERPCEPKANAIWSRHSLALSLWFIHNLSTFALLLLLCLDSRRRRVRIPAWKNPLFFAGTFSASCLSSRARRSEVRE